MKNMVTIVVVTVVAVFATTGLVLRYGVAARSPAAPRATVPNTRTIQGTAPELDQLLAPVALYPDSLLAQVLLCTSDPQQVIVLNNWLKKQTKKGTALQDAALQEGFDASFVAMALFPQVIDWMAQRIDWTTQLGKAFAADRSAVFNSIQRLRAEAQKTGVLKDTPQQVVETKTTSTGEQAIVIEPANPQVIYVPQYNPTVVYTQPATTTTVVVKEDNTDEAIAAGFIGFTAGIAIGAAIDNDYYYGPYGWHGGGYMYNDAWDDYYDHREDAREDWMDHREDMMEERGDRAENAREQRTDRAENRSGTQSERQANRQSGTTQSRTSATSQSKTTSATAQTRTAGGSTYESRGRTTDSTTTRDRTGTRSDAFSGYSSGSSTRAASSRGQSSRGSARRSGGGGRRR